MLNRLHIVNSTACRRFLLEKTQHVIGGFGKGVGEVPGIFLSFPPSAVVIFIGGSDRSCRATDIMHSYLGLANLGLLGESGVASVDPTFCTSKRTRQHLESLPWWGGSGLPGPKATGEDNCDVNN